MFTTIVLFFVACGSKDGDTSTNNSSQSDDNATNFCELYTATCREWSSDTSCVDWYSAAEAGTEGDSSGATQACYDYHLDVASGVEDQGEIDAHCSHAVGAADSGGNAPCQ